MFLLTVVFYHIRNYLTVICVTKSGAKFLFIIVKCKYEIDIPITLLKLDIFR